MAKLDVTEGTILSSAIGSGQSTSRAQSGGYNTRISHRPDISYQYTVNGQQYTNNAYAQRPFLINNLGIVQSILNNYPVNKTVKIYYNPDNPAESYLQKGYGGAVNLILIGVLVFVILIIGVVAFFVLTTGI